jgi:hypothetical protein
MFKKFKNKKLVRIESKRIEEPMQDVTQIMYHTGYDFTK